MADVGEIRARLVLSSDQFNRGMRDARTQMNNTGQSARRVSKDISKIHNAALGMGTALAIGVGASIKTAADFEKKMSDIKSVSGATADQMKQFSDLAKEAGKTTAFSATESAGAIEELVKAGLSMEQIMDGGLKGALDLAAAGGIELADAAEIASTALNAFKSDNLKVVDAANLLAGAANASATDIGELKFGLSAVSAVSAGVGMSFADTTTALAVFAQNGLKGSDAGTSLKTMLMNLTPSGKRARETMHELGIAMADGTNKFYDAHGKIKSLADISGVLRDALIKLNPKERGEALKDMFGSDAIRAGNILFKEGAKGVEAMASAMSKITAAETAATKLDNFHGSVEALKGSMETLGIEIGEDFLPLLTDFAREITKVISAMDSTDLANLKAGLSFAGVSTSIVLAGTSLAKLGIAARGLFLAMGGPLTLTIGAIALLGGAIAGAVVKNREMEAARLDNIEAGFEEVRALDASIKQYDNLKNQSKLTNDEFGRYLDLQAELRNTSDPKAITRIKDEMERLREKSGLSNKQLETMVSLNKDIVDKTPEVAKAISEQGQAYVGNTDAVKKFNKAKLESMYNGLDLQRIENETKYKNLVQEEKDLIEKIKVDSGKLKTLNEGRDDAQTKATKSLNKYKDMLRDSSKYSAAELETAHQTYATNQQAADTYQKQLETKAKSLQKSQDELTTTQKSKAKLDDINARMAQILLKQEGLNSKRGQEVKTINSVISKLEGQKRALEKSVPVNQRNTDEYRNARDAIQQQINNLQGVRSKVEDIIGAGKTLNSVLSAPVTKNITTYQKVVSQGSVKSGQMRQDEFHTGGIIGRGQMPMLHTGGLASKFANAASHNEVDVRLLRNEMVLTEAQQANLMRLIDAGMTNKGGVSTASNGADLARVVDAISSRPINVGVIVDGREIAKATAKYNQEELDLLNARKGRMGGAN